MRILKWFIVLVIVLALVIGVGGMLLPREVTIARTIDVNTPADQVFPHLNAMQAIAAWSPWLDRDPNVQLTYSGPDVGVGNKLQWASDHPQVGNGTQEITASEPGKHVTTALDFGEMGVAKAQFILNESSGVTTVIWTLDTDMGAGPIGRWMGLMMDRWVDGDHETGLQNLKTLVEG